MLRRLIPQTLGSALGLALAVFGLGFAASAEPVEYVLQTPGVV